MPPETVTCAPRTAFRAISGSVLVLVAGDPERWIMQRSHLDFRPQALDYAMHWFMHISRSQFHIRGCGGVHMLLRPRSVRLAPARTSSNPWQCCAAGRAQACSTAPGGRLPCMRPSAS